MNSWCRQQLHICLIIGLLMVSVRCFCAQKDAATRKPILRILNWDDYIDVEGNDSTKSIVERSETLKRFSEKFNCQIQYDTYNDSVDLLTNLDRFKQYDLIVVANAEIPFIISRNLIDKLDKALVPNEKFINQKFMSVFTDPEDFYSVPYLVGTTGILYRSDLVQRPVSSLKPFFEGQKSDSRSRIGLYNDCSTMFPFALLYLNERVDPENSIGIRKAANVLEALKASKRIGVCTSDMNAMSEKLVKGEINMAIMYSGDALSAIESNPSKNLVYVLPDEGGEFYIDSFVICKNSPNKTLAHQFINFVLEPENHARIAGKTKFYCPNDKSIPIIRKEYPGQLSNPAIYPPREIMNKLYFFFGFSKNALSKQLWQKIFNQDDEHNETKK